MQQEESAMQRWQRTGGARTILGISFGLSLGLMGLGLTSATPATAPQGVGKPEGVGIPDGVGGGPPSLAATPELGSLALFGSGTAGMAGYAALRLRAARSRRRSSGEESHPAA